jgi:hypothetical protein
MGFRDDLGKCDGTGLLEAGGVRSARPFPVDAGRRYDRRCLATRRVP